jgi:hypothetical protein
MAIFRQVKYSRSLLSLFRRSLTASMGKDSYRAAASDSQEQYGQCKARKLQEVLGRSDISLHSLGVYHQENTSSTTRDSRQPVPFAVEAIWSALPCGISDYSRNRRCPYEKSEQKQSINNR